MPGFQPFHRYPGGFSPQDGTIDFYPRVRSYATAAATVLDLGAGRGAWFDGDPADIRRRVRHLTPDVGELIAADVDAAVLENKSSTRNIIVSEGVIPLPDESVDIVIADYVLEHIADPVSFFHEINRVLRPAGIFCARTPHRWHYAAVAARLIGHAGQLGTLAALQPDRSAKDVFPTVYALNTIRAIERTFRGWHSQSFIYSSDPAYFFGSRLVYRLFQAIHAATPPAFHGNIFAFLQKPAQTATNMESDNRFPRSDVG